MAVARKLFRLAKFFNEYLTIKKTLAGDAKPVDKYLTVATRLAFLLYWVFDNLGVLVKIKFLHGFDLANTVRRANSFWLLGLVLTLIGGIRSMIKLISEAGKLKAAKALIGKEGGMDEAAFKDAVTKHKATRLTTVFTIIKALGDTTTASQGLGYPKQFLGFDFNDGLVGIGGFTSAALSCYQVYPAK